MQDIILNDERKGQFKFMWEYNSDINQKTKIPIKARGYIKVLNVMFNAAMIIFTVVVMVYF